MHLRYLHPGLPSAKVAVPFHFCTLRESATSAPECTVHKLLSISFTIIPYLSENLRSVIECQWNNGFNTSFYIYFFQKYKIIESKTDLPDARTLARGALDDVFLAMQSFVIQKIVSGPRRAAITLDLWTDRYRRPITFTYHDITPGFVLRRFTLSTHLIKGRHTGEAISDEIQSLLDKYSLGKKYLFAVTDRGANVKNGVREAGLENGDCLGHGLHNLVLREGMEAVPQVSIKHIQDRRDLSSLIY